MAINLLNFINKSYFRITIINHIQFNNLVFTLLLCLSVHLTSVNTVNHSQESSKIIKCPNPNCVTREAQRDFSEISDDFDDFTRRKRDILTEIKSASSRKIESTKRLSSSFSQGYIDLGSRDPRDEGAATLAFVFDTTGSMYDDLKQVIEGAGKILKTVLEKFERPIHNYILVPFNDPDIGSLTVTSDPEEFKSELHELQYFIQGGGDCPEMAVGAIKMALEACLPSSYIYVFTDARAKDYYLLDEVLHLIQKKHTQVVFVMTGDCGNQTHPGYLAFETIASTSSGQVFHLNKSDVDEVLNFVQLSLESRKVNLLSVDRQFNQPGEENLELLVDNTIREFTISVSGEKPTIEIYRPEATGEYTREDRIDELLTLENVKIVGVKEPTPGRYNISVGSDSRYTVRATGLSSIDFHTGFSLKPTTNFKETYHRPMKGGNSFVLVKPIDETEFGDLYRLQLISLDGEPLVDIPLNRLPGHETLFKGSAVNAPDQPFNVKIFGRDRDGYDFERISSTAVSAQLPFPPEVAAKEAEIGFYDRSVVITCHVQTLVPFNVTWKKNGKEIQGPIRYPQSAEVSFVIEKPTTADEGIYTCLATNVAGSSIGNIFLDVKEPPPEIIARGNVSLTPGRPGLLTCEVTSTVKFNVTWARYVIKGQVQDFFGRVETVGEFIAVEDAGSHYVVLHNNSLMIEEVVPEDNGWFRCTSANEGGSRAKEIYVEVQALPEITVYPQTGTFKEGQNITLKCSARGIPPPVLYWKKGDTYFSSRNGPRATVDVNHTLTIQDATMEDEGIYVCSAENPAGRVDESISMAFVEAPKIVAVEKNILAQSGDAATLHCYAQGTPPPTIRWFKSDSTEVVPMSFIEIEGGYLRISGVQESDAGTYTCVATNGAGTVEDHVTLRIGSSPSALQDPTDQTIDVGGAGGLSCYGSGVPQPTIKWSRSNGQPLPSNFFEDESGTLRISGMKIEDEGTYICTLENSYGRKELTATLSVSGLLPPLIAAPPNPHFEVVSHQPVIMPCTVVMAAPSPSINWFFQGKPVELTEGMFVTREGDLRIPSTQGHHEGSYECVARNVAGNSSLSVFLNVLEPPMVREGRLQEEIKVTEGNRVRLKCPVVGDPKPSYSWQRNGQPIMPFQKRMRIVTDGTLIIRGVAPTDGGVYVCTAVNAAGATNTAVTLSVLVPPTIEEDLSTFTVVEGEEVELPCRTIGFPLPVVQWVRPDLEDRNLNATVMPDGSLRVNGAPHAEGPYECLVNNEAGSTRKLFNLIVNKAPEIFPTGDEKLSVVAGEDIKLPCVVKGYPKPEVIWFRNKKEIIISDDMRSFDGYLLMRNVSPNLRGEYSCKAENRAGVEYKNIFLEVEFTPYIETQLLEHQILDLIEGSSIILPCPSTGNPSPRRHWTKDGEPLKLGNRLFLDIDGTVVIEGARRDHSGLYDCSLINSVGTANITYAVNVMVPPKLTQKEERKKSEVVEGEDITIRCPVDAFPVPSINWLKDGVTIFSTKDRADVTHIIVEDNGQTLHIFEATLDDQGVYRCIVRNSAGETSLEFPLKVLVPPQFTTFLHEPEMTVKEGEEVGMDCSVLGEPEPKVEWDRNGFKLPSLYPQVSPDRRHIRIAKVTQADAGLYTCIAVNSAGTTARNFSLTVYAAPMIDALPGRLESNEVIAVMGQDKRIHCRVSGSPFPSVLWSFGDVLVEKVTDLQFSLQEKNQVLILHSLSPESSGRYVCNATNAVGSMIKEYNVSVFMPPYIGEAGDYVTEVEDVKTNAQETLRLSCSGGGFPTPEYSWFWENRPLSPSMMSYQTEGENIILNRVRVENSGIFTCLAVNPAGTAEKHFKVQVQVPAKIGSEYYDGRKAYSKAPSAQEAIVDSSFMLYCPAFGIPEPSVAWSKDGKPIDIHWQKVSIRNTTTTNVTNVEGVSTRGTELSVSKTTWSGRLQASERGKRLVIDSAIPEDSGTYTCTAQNEAGADSMDMTVSVMDPPKIVEFSPSPIMISESFPLNLNCIFEGTPNPTASWLFNGADLKTLPIHGVEIDQNSPKKVALYIDRVGREHVGVYTCLVTSLAGSDEISYDVNVAIPPVAERSLLGGSQAIITRANRPVTLECSVDSFPPPEIQWFTNDLPIDPPSNEKYRLSLDKRSLTILRTSPADAGNYTCVATNSAGSADVEFSLEIHVPPHIEGDVIEEVTVEEGKEAYLYCPVAASPVPSILWMKGSNIVTNAFTAKDPKKFTIAKAARDDQGRYTCLATNEAGTLEQSFTLNVLMPPKLENKNKAIVDENVIVNRPVSISCFIVVEPKLSIEWSKNGVPLLPTEPGLTIAPSGSRLHIAQARPKDAGNYTCTASNAAGQINITTSLHVLQPPTWRQNVSEMEEIIGIFKKEITLNCEVDGSPQPTILWLKDGQLIPSDSTEEFQDITGWTLIIPRPDESKAGLYSCIASNAAGTLERNVRVLIHRPPYLTSLPRTNFQVLKNRPAHFECSVSGKPEPDITWTVDDELIDESSKFIQLSNSKKELHILRAMGAGNVSVTCLANNTIGELETNFILEVLSPPLIHPSPPTPEVSAVEGQRLVLRCDASGHPAPKVFWTTGKGKLLSLEDSFSWGIRIDDSGETLEFMEILGDQEGKYICAASNIGGHTDFTYNVQVNLAPVIRDPANGYHYINEHGSPLIITCEVDSRPKSVIKWYKDGESLNSFHDPFVYLTDGDQHLRFLRVLDHHEGTYKCVANNEAGHDERQFTLKVLLPPTIVEGSSTNVEAAVDNSFELKCEVEGNPKPIIKWKKGDIILVPSAKREFQNDNEVLRVINASISDAGIYACVASSSMGSDQTEFNVDIHSPPVIEKSLSNEQRPILSNSHILRCEAKGIPTPVISWTRRGSTLTKFSDRNIQIQDDGRELQIVRVREMDGGYYTCVASSLSGQDSKTFSLTVVVPPKIESANQPSTISGVAGKWTELVCESSGSPSPEITWRKYDKIISNSDDRIQISGVGGSRLRISRLNPVDSGIYTCDADNEAGIDARNLTLQVMIPPTLSEGAEAFKKVKEGSNVVIVCPIEALPEPTFIWTSDSVQISEEGKGNMEIRDSGATLKIVRVNREDAATYTCIASNAAGTAQHSVDLQVTVPPLIVGGSDSEEEYLKVIEGGHVSFECLLQQGQPTPIRSWLQGPNLMSANHTIVGEGDSMIIPKALINDSGTYQCIARNDVGISTKSYRLIVQAPPNVDVQKLLENDMKLEDSPEPPLPPDGRPRQTSLKTSVVAIEGSTLTILCPIEGNPTPRILWYKGSHALLPSHRIIQNPTESSITIANLLTSDAGAFTCVGVNPAGETELVISLIVEGRPVIEGEANEDIPSVSGQPVSLECRIVFASTRFSSRGPLRHEMVDVTWTKNGHPIPEELFHTKFENEKENGENETLEENTYDYSDYFHSTNSDLEDENNENFLSESEEETRISRNVSSNVNKKGPLRKTRKISEEFVYHDYSEYFSSIDVESLNKTTTIKEALNEKSLLKLKSKSISAPRYSLSNDNTKLSILRAKKEDEGEYACVVTNKAGKAKKSFDVKILMPPSIDTLEEIRVFEAAVGEPVVFECNANGQPPPEITWYKGERPVSPSSRHQFLESSHVLIIQSVQNEDAGQYTCYASNVAGTSIETFTLTVLVPPRLDGRVEERIEIISGRTVKLECPMEGSPTPEVVWSFGNEVLSFENDYVRRVGNDVVIDRVTADLAGEYVCDGTNAVGRSFKIIHLIVKDAPSISGNPHTELETVIEGDAATLHCLASGQPLPTLHWEKDGSRIRLDNRVSVSWGGRTLLIQNVGLPDAGRYSCTASNSAGNDTRLYRLNVMQPPKIEEGPNEIVAVEGEIITVFCSISGNPVPKITWHHNGDKITEVLNEPEVSMNETIQEDPEVVDEETSVVPQSRGLLGSGALQFSPIRLDHVGNYTCAADNEAGRAVHSFPVSVLLPPSVSLEITPPIAIVGETVELVCSIEGSQPIALSWKKGHMPLRPGPEFQIGTNGTLKISEVALYMSDTYTCSAKNPAGSDEAIQTLIVHELPRVQLASKEIIVTAGQEAELVCLVSGQPTPTVKWTMPDLAGREITPVYSRVQIWENRLVIFPVVDEDMGTYRCTATNRAGSDYDDLSLVVTSVPTIMEPLDEEINVVLGETINLSCTPTSGYPPPSVIWRKEGRHVKTSSRTNLATNGEIVIENAKAEDSGMYSCLAVNAAGRLYRVVHVVVEVPPRLTLLPRTQEVTRGDSFVLDCEAAGVPSPTISWLLNGTEVEGAAPSIGGKGRLQIDRAAKSDEGTYTCLAKNTAGHRKAVAGIRVKVPPVIMHSPGEMTVQELSSVMLTCLAEGDPYPAVTWTKEGHYITASDRVHLMKNGSLVIDASKGSDTGVYKCVVSNDAGAAEAVSHLRVMMPPKITKGPLSKEVAVGETVIFNCEAEGEPKPEVQWSVANKDMNNRYKTLTNGSLQLIAVQIEDEGQVICQVFNDLGEDLAKADVSVRVPGMWGEWGSWSQCSSSCGVGEQTQQRHCDSPAPRNGGKYCQGEDISSRPCRLQACPVDGGWSLWDNWSECSVSCGGGRKTRERICNNPEPLHGGKKCEGLDQEEVICKLKECPINGDWSEWSTWTECSRTCGEALHQRTRICNNPPPSAGGSDCDGSGLEVKPCSGEPCQIDGNWSKWGSWSSCSQSCGTSIKYRKRRCDDPMPENDGKECEGEGYEEDKCDVQPCVIHGQWSPWTVWGPCSTTCGRGHRQRFRLCDNPAPKDGGQICRGPDLESQPCSSSPCPVHGNWGSWSEWSSCSKTCGQGVRERTRRCNNPHPRNGGDMCTGSSRENIACEDLSCRDLPLRAYGTLRGWLNSEDLGVISLAGNITTSGNQRTLVMSLSPILPQYATWLTPLISVVSSAFWASAFEADGAFNGNSLTKSTFTRESRVTFGSGERVDISQTAKGVDESGTLRFNVEVDGNVPYLPPGSFVTVQPFSEEYIQTGDGSLYVKSKRIFAVNGYHFPYMWNETIDYAALSGLMPTLRQTLHANSVSASYRCLAGIEGSNTRGELSIMISSVIMPSSEGKTCPDGFSLAEDGNKNTPICKDENECQSEDTHCSHVCRNIVGGYFCDCPPGHTIGSDGKTCEDIDECQNNLPICGPREECTNTPGSYTCTYSCKVGFQRTLSGTACEDIDECQEKNPCEQLCQNLLGSYRCDCYEGFTLDSNSQCIDIDECVVYTSPCSHKCTNTPGSFQCSCPAGFQLLNNGRCKDIDECSSFQHNCTDNEQCQNYEGGFSCVSQCPSGLRKTNNGSCIDINECGDLTAGCHYTQKCENMWGTYRCSCQRGYKSMGPGHPCIDINECQGSPPPCNYECRNLMGDYECICPPGMKRLHNRKTCVAIQYDDEPQLQLSHHSSPYIRQRPPLPGYPTREYQQRLLRRVYRVTQCDEGFLSDGDQCKDLNECSKPGRCQHACENTHGSFFCICPPGYRLGENKHSCEDIDECQETGNDCNDEQRCINLFGSFRCVQAKCPEGYQNVGKEGSCLVDCVTTKNICPSGVNGSHRIVHKWVPLASGVIAFQDILSLSATDEKGYELPHTQFSITAKDYGTDFRIRQENGEGVLSIAKGLNSGAEYRLVVEANSIDAILNSIKYSTTFVIFLQVSEYPY